MRHALILTVVLLADSALADAPLPPPEKLTICSASKKVCAVSDPVENTTVISSQDGNKASWQIPGWHRWFFVSDDGDSVVVGGGLAPEDVTLEEPVLRFFNRGRLVRTVTLGDLYNSKSELAHTASHFVWYRTLKLNKVNQLLVELVNEKTVAFAANTGKIEPITRDGN